MTQNLHPHRRLRFSGWRDRFLALVTAGDTGEKDLQYWRVRILMTLLGSGLAMGIFILIPAALMAFQEHLWGLLVGHGSIVIFGGFLFFHPRISYETRAKLTLFICYGIGMIVIANVGPLSGGPAWLFCFAVLAGVLLGVRAAAVALAVNGITLTALGASMLGGVMGPEGVHFVTSARAVVAGLNFMLLNAVAAVSVAVLVRGLRVLSEKEQAAAASLRMSEERYRLLTENIEDVIWTVDLNLRYTYISPAIERMQGWAPEEIQKMRLEQVLAPDSFQAATDIFAEQMALGEATGDYNRSKIFEVELCRADGSTVWAEVTASFQLDQDGKPVGILGVTRDITERLKAQREKADLQDKLTRARKMEALGLLAGGVAHDLNNILSGVLSYPELLLMDLPEQSRFRKPLETIRDSGKRAAAVVSDLITVARGVASQREVIDLAALVKQFLDGPEFKSLQRGHRAVSVDMAPRADLLRVRGSAVHLEKVLMNLVANAMEAVRDKGSVRISMENRYLDEPLAGTGESAIGEYVVLAVADDGPGISQEDRERIFEPFYTRKIMGRSGTGLGLTVVWNTVKDHDGFIDVQCDDSGTTFRIFLPATREKVFREEAVQSLDGLMGAGERILIVDDEPAQREIAGRMLARLGYNSFAVESGEAALARLREEPFELILLDMMMPPGIDGRETFQRAVALRPGQKAILASGYSETADVSAAQRLGAGKYLRKPFSLNDLARAVREELMRG